MPSTILGRSQAYPRFARNTDGNAFHSCDTHRLCIPTEQDWSVTLYNTETQSQVHNGTEFFSTSTFSEPDRCDISGTFGLSSSDRKILSLADSIALTVAAADHLLHLRAITSRRRHHAAWNRLREDVETVFAGEQGTTRRKQSPT